MEMVDEENAFAGNEWEAECWRERAVIMPELWRRRPGEISVYDAGQFTHL